MHTNHGILEDGKLLCTKCNQPKSSDEFYERKSIARGYDYVCRSCVSEIRSVRRLGRTPTDADRAQGRKYYLNNREKCIAHVSNWRRTRATAGIPKIYFIEDPANFTKIGFTELAVETRLTSLQIGNPRRLQALGWIPGTQDQEKQIHKRFCHLSERGEWFRQSFELSEFIYIECGLLREFIED